MCLKLKLKLIYDRLLVVQSVLVSGTHLGPMTSPAELTAIFYCLIWDSPNLEGQIHVFISTKNRVAQLYSRALNLCAYNEQEYFILV
jgi:hypothetical protein